MGSRVQSIVGCYLALCFLPFWVAQVLVGLRKKFINNLVFPAWPCAAGFNNNNNNSGLRSLVHMSTHTWAIYMSDVYVHMSDIHNNGLRSLVHLSTYERYTYLKSMLNCTKWGRAIQNKKIVYYLPERKTF